jgi:NTE family protein
MTSKKDYDVLKHISLFSELQDSVLEKIESKLLSKKFSDNEIIFEENDEGNCLYIVISGQVEISVENKESETIHLATLKNGEVFGELALLTNLFRTATAKAKKNCRLKILMKSDFNDIFKKHSSVAYAICNDLSKRLAAANKKISDDDVDQLFLLVNKDKNAKHFIHFINYFKQLCDHETIILHQPSKETISNYLSNKKQEALLIVCPTGDNDYRKIVTETINFDENIPKQTYLAKTLSNEQIERLTRKITKKTIGIALSSGTAPGLAHLGIMKTLIENNIPIDYIAGTSGGALYGAPFAFNIPFETTYNQLAKIYKQALFRLWDPALSTRGLFKGKRLLNRTLAKIVDAKNIEDSHIPFAAVATDLYDGSEKIFTSGNLKTAVRSSLSIPLLFTPVKLKKELLVDGVVTTPIPISALENAGINIKIAAFVSELPISKNKHPNMLSTFLRARNISSDFIASQSIDKADVIIKPKLDELQQFDYNKIDRIIELGEIAAQKAIPRIKKLLKGK